MVNTIGNPGQWAVKAVGDGAGHVPGLFRAIGGSGALPEVNRLNIEDLRGALRDGVADFAAFRSDVMFACLLYPVIGLIVAWFAFDNELLPLLFPMMAGFALVGPVAAIGLYEMSRRRAEGLPASWADGFKVLSSPSLVPILCLSAALFVIFAAWIGAAALIYNATLGPEPPASISAFAAATLGTGAGWAMVVIGFAVGFVFALTVLAISVVSFPLLIDRNVGLVAAIVTSVRVFMANPRIVLTWGALIAAALALASVPLFLGLIVVMPVLGHATWHLYRRAVQPSH